jgi:shikimate kinase/3-dehydroquinate synthase
MRLPNIVLTGFMGTGKTTAGRLLAERLGRPFVDTDQLIEQRTGRSIPTIFAEQGEPYFRALERVVAQALAGQTGLVIATGGRLLLDSENAAVLGRNSLIFCLTAEPEEILARLESELDRRPLLASADPAGRVRSLLQERADRYGRFTQVNTSGQTPGEVAGEILRRLESSEPPAGAPVAATAASSLTVAFPGGQYDVHVGYGLLPRLTELAALDGPFVVVGDSNVVPLYAAECGLAQKVISIPAGEAYKTLDTVRLIYDELLAAGLDRQGTIVALGGGVVGDITGFVAATYLRGVRFVQCPTSLLAMVDSSVGAKVGVDLPQGKNLVGAFKQPAAVIADLNTLQTLPAEELAAGMAEVVKGGLIGSPNLLALIEMGQIENPKSQIPNPKSPISNLQSLILQAIEVKRDVVQEDPFEQGRRALLNLGHTFGHAIEQVSGYSIRHGEGVAIGLVAAAHLSAELGYCSPRLVEWITAILTKLNLPTRLPTAMQPAEILQAMGTDKKRADGRLRFILLRGIGDVFVANGVPEAAVIETLTAIQE